jgi:glycosyltransferase involved in cell wall biosynthesis
VISIHNAFPAQTFSPWTAAILQQAFHSVKGVYAVSDSALEYGLQLFAPFMRPKTLSQVIYNPIDTQRFRPSQSQRLRIRNQLKLPPEALLIGMVGRLDKQKQPELLIDVFARLNKRYPHLQLLLIGQGPREAACRHSIQAHGLEHAVHMVGYQSNIEHWLPALDVHVLLSSREGFGIATAEAMACGVPVVATDVTGSCDILQHSQAGLLVPNGKPKAIAKAIAALLDDAPLRQRMAAAGPREVAERFASPLIQLHLADFYHQVFARV